MAPAFARGVGVGGLGGLSAFVLAFGCTQPAQEVAPDLDAGPTGWVKIYDPGRASNGYTLTLAHGRVPTLIDMNGRTVHAWPEARVKSRVRLLPDGALLGIGLGREVVEYDWDGREQWRFDTGTDLPHHDVIRLANGNTMFPVLPDREKTDDILEVDHAGNVVWRWPAGEYLAPYIDEAEAARRDVTHINSIQELGENRWFEAGDDRFRPGNLLISPRNLNQVFVIERASGKVVWSYDHELDMQHEALMTPLGYPGAGNITLFNNGLRNRFGYRSSTVLEIDPAEAAVEWRYGSEDFFSPTGGVQQALPNGNLLIGSTRGGRIFEVDRNGRLVWQWVAPFDPVRPARYGYDHCPQLEALAVPRERPVRPPPDYRHVDKPLYRFADDGGLRKEKLDGKQQTVLADNGDCRRLRVPSQALLEVAYGVDRKRALETGAPPETVRFALTARPDGDDEATEIFTDRIGLDGERWRQQTVPLGKLGLLWVEICVVTEAVATSEATESYAFWSNPAIGPIDLAKEDATGHADSPEPQLTPEELEARQRHLKALGYID